MRLPAPSAGPGRKYELPPISEEMRPGSPTVRDEEVAEKSRAELGNDGLEPSQDISEEGPLGEYIGYYAVGKEAIPQEDCVLLAVGNQDVYVHCATEYTEFTFARSSSN